MSQVQSVNGKKDYLGKSLERTLFSDFAILSKKWLTTAARKNVYFWSLPQSEAASSCA